MLHQAVIAQGTNDLMISEQLIFTMIAGVIQLGIFVWLIVMAVLDRRSFVRHWKRGLMFYSILVVLSLPVVAAKMYYFEPGGPQAAIAKTAHHVVLVIQLPLSIGIGLLYFVVAASEWLRVNHHAMPLLTRRPQVDWRPIRLAGLIGLGYGLVSTLVFIAIGVESSRWMIQLLKNYPGLETTPVGVNAALLALVVIVAALAEEVIFRGALLGFFTRLGGDRGPTPMFLVGALVTSVLFASLHLLNTNFPAVKFIQIFLFSLLAAELTRRYCLEAAIACHLGLNLAALTMISLG